MDGQHRGKGRRGRGGGWRRNQDESRDMRLSRSLTYALRHGAAKLGLNMGSDGFIFVDELLSHGQFSSFSPEDVERVVAMDDKQRFKLQVHPENGRLQIRANQGHTVQVQDLELTAVVLDAPDCPQEAVHGSYMKHWPSIRSRGLCRMDRTHIHLAPGLPGEGQVISGMRHNCDLAVYINVHKALADGIEFYWSENKVLLTPGDADGVLGPQYFLRAQRLKPSSCDLDLE
ncbi:tRNA 2'-phosphotransferase 1 [Ictalurus furcatus]|uniref:tRNA 2'-phosphotransferase 1 n=1 Tax=Ictalurus furcatus TaxID=66913 RepID=UPI002350AE31|nr:tRNA 2'-phosphotransferase 1 [Ictalurus furcatus]XP_053487032.1 tRNA 2'-phosphotransferase 1 [Ictalurus furcatus]XP_053487033.1 tRNA 2'-phosphotransferase 1 [Ictalurus furcatus]